MMASLLKETLESMLDFATPQTYEAILEKLEDCKLRRIVREREHEKASAVEVSLDEL
jgi:hypothetical protein